MGDAGEEGLAQEAGAVSGIGLAEMSLSVKTCVTRASPVTSLLLLMTTAAAAAAATEVWVCLQTGPP